MTFLNLGKAAALLTHIDGEIAGKKKTLISWTGERGHIKAAAYFDFVPLKITSFKSPFVRSNTICSADWHWFHALLHFLKQARENLCCGRVVVTMSEHLEIQLSALCNVGGEYSNDKHSCTSLCINAAQVKIVDKCTGVIVDSNLQLHQPRPAVKPLEPFPSAVHFEWDCSRYGVIAGAPWAPVTVNVLMRTA